MQLEIKANLKEDNELVEQIIEDFVYGKKKLGNYIKLNGKYIKLTVDDEKLNIKTKKTGTLEQYLLYCELLKDYTVVSDSVTFNIYILVANPEFVEFYLRALAVDVELAVKPIYGMLVRLPVGLTYKETEKLCRLIQEIAIPKSIGGNKYETQGR